MPSIHYMLPASSYATHAPQQTNKIVDLGLQPYTLMVVFSDNGGSQKYGASNFPLRGSKGGLFEGGVRSRGFLWGGAVPPAVRGTTWAGLMHVTDIFPTVLSASGLSSRAEACDDAKPLDGIDLWSAISAGSASPRTSVLVNIGTGSGSSKTSAIRVGDYKLLLNQKKGDCSSNAQGRLCSMNGAVPVPTTSGDANLRQSGTATAVQLFNVNTDPSEQKDLSTSQPDKVAELKAALEKFTVAKAAEATDMNAAKAAAAKAKHMSPWIDSKTPASDPTCAVIAGPPTTTTGSCGEVKSWTQEQTGKTCKPKNAGVSTKTEITGASSAAACQAACTDGCGWVNWSTKLSRCFVGLSKAGDCVEVDAGPWSLYQVISTPIPCTAAPTTPTTTTAAKIIKPTSPAFNCTLSPDIHADLSKYAKQQPLCKGFLDVTLPPYNAAGDGVTDDTVAVSQAIQDAFKNDLVAFFPANKRFLISKQIRMIQTSISWQVAWDGYQLLGSKKGTPPVLVLKDGSTVQDNIFLYFRTMTDGKEDDPNHYGDMIRGVNIDMGNNPNVTALSMSGAQRCSIEDVSISGSAFYAGIKDLPGSGGFSGNIEIDGGKIGIWQTQFRPNPSITNLVLRNQSWTGVWHQRTRGPLVLSGFEIRSPDAPAANYRAVRVHGEPNRFNMLEGDGSLALEDGLIVVKGEQSVAIDTISANLAFRNVYFQADTTVQETTRFKWENPEPSDLTTVLKCHGSGSKPWNHIEKWVRTETNTHIQVTHARMLSYTHFGIAYMPDTQVEPPMSWCSYRGRNRMPALTRRSAT